MTVVVGFSGGADSVCLLHNLLFLRDKYNLEIIAVHINHNLRGEEAERDAEFCRDLCKKWNIKFKLFDEDAAVFAFIKGIGIEEAGRILRYSILNKVALEQGFDCVMAIAHNKNDVAETALMQIFRGAARVRGIQNSSRITRPLIGTSRDEIIAYNERYNLEYCKDSTNNDNSFRRNYIRNELLPIIEKNINPSVVDALSRLSLLSNDEDNFMEKISNEAFLRCFDKNILDINELTKQHISIQRRIVWIFLSANQVFDSKYTNMTLELCNAKSGTRIDLPKNIVVRRQYSKIIFEKRKEQKSLNIELEYGKPTFITGINKWICLNKEIFNQNAFTMELICDKIDKVCVRTRLPGDYIYFSNVGTKKIKDFFIDKKIPRDIRDQTVFVAAGSEIIYIFDGILSHGFEAKDKSENTVFLQIWEDS